jgi:hypothetical protein
MKSEMRRSLANQSFEQKIRKVGEPANIIQSQTEGEQNENQNREEPNEASESGVAC